MKFSNRILADDVCVAPDCWGLHEVVIDRAEACLFMADGISNIAHEIFVNDFKDHRDWGYTLYEHEGKFYIADSTCDMFCEIKNPLDGGSTGMVACVGDWTDLSKFETEEN